MAEERTLGLARASEPVSEELSKEELQRRMDDARDSISHTVTEIKETVANQYQAVKDTLDWREQFKKRPVEWAAGALGVGFVVGYGLAAVVKGDGNGDDDYSAGSYETASRRVRGQGTTRHAASLAEQYDMVPDTEADDGPGLLERLTTTPAYDRVKSEVAGIGNSILDDLSKTAKQVLVPAVLKSIKDFLGGYLPTGATTPAQSPAQSNVNDFGQGQGQTRGQANYQPIPERRSN